ncbi:helix-turn-helix domain-containing protein [Roseateles sp. P5_E1]
MKPQPRLDRLSAFLSAFPLGVRATQGDENPEPAHLFLLEGPEPRSRRIVFCSTGRRRPACAGEVLLGAVVDFGGDANPLLRSMPTEIALDTSQTDPLWAIATQFHAEATVARCGGAAALARLGELLVLMVFRQAIDQGATQPGVLAGLAHPQLRYAVGALLEHPARNWPMEELAARSALSRSQFMLAFRRTLGMTPGAFHTAWRLTLAHRSLQRGERVKAVSAACGYGSAAAFSRAYVKAFGHSPSGAASNGQSAPSGA